MKEESYSDKVIVRYLLGQASPGEQTDFEQKYFTDPELLERLSCVEDELIDAYVRHELPEDKRRQFEKNFMTEPGRRERVTMAEALIRCIPSPDQPSARLGLISRQPGPGRYRSTRMTLAVGAGLSSILLIAVLWGSWLFLTNSRLRDQLDRTREANTALEIERDRLQRQVAEQQAHNDLLDQEVQRYRNQPDRLAAPESRAIAAFSLFPGMPRDVDGLQKLSIPPGTRGLRLELILDAPGKYKYYEAALSTMGGAKIWGRSKLTRAESNSAIVLLPASLLSDGDYLLTLTASERGGETVTIGDYAFTIGRR